MAPSSRKIRLTTLVLLLAALACSPGPDGGIPEAVVRDNVRGTAYLGQLNWSESESSFSDAIEQRGDDPLLLTNLAIAQLQQGRLDEAEASLMRATALDAAFVPALYNLGLIANRRGDYEQAAEHFGAVAQLDTEDLFTQYYLGSSLARIDREEDALRAFRAALERDPTHVSTLYGLGRLLLQRGEQEEGLRLVERSQAIRARSGLDATVGTEYGEQGPYGMGIDYPGNVIAAPPATDVSFEVDLRGRTSTESPGPWTVWRAGRADLPQLVVADGNAVRRAFGESATAPLAASPEGTRIVGLAAGDVDDDGSVELVMAWRDAGSLALGLGSGRVLDRMDSADANAAVVTLFDRDHDGDLDLVWCAAAACRVVTNDGQGAFEGRSSVEHGFEITADSLTFSDLDNDRDVDLIASGPDGVQLLSNQRDGTFRVTVLYERPSGFALSDVDKNGTMDLILGGAGGLGLVLNTAGRLGAPDPLAGFSTPTSTPLVVDYDNDGFLDIAVGTENGPRLVRDEGAGAWSVVELPGGSNAWPLAAFDSDGDGDRDIVLYDPAGKLVGLRNEGGNANTWLTIESTGLADNHYGIGTKVEILSGALRQKLEITDTLPLQVGLGRRDGVQSVRYLWPSGVLQDELDLAAGRTAEIGQLDRKGSSCPLLYAWHDGEWRFVTDFLGGAAVGYLLAPGVYNTPDTDEYVPIPFALTPDRDGLVRVRANNQLEEVLWFDRMQLLAVDHPQGAEVLPNERLMPGPPYPDFKLFASDDVRPVVAARSVDTGRDVTETVRTVDRRYVDDFELLPPKGYATMHTLELDLGSWTAGSRAVLTLDGWIDYADSSSNLAAAQAGLVLVPPRLHVADGRSGWVERPGVMGFPAGLPKPLSVEIGDLFPSDDHRIRISTNMRIYWDRARIMVGGGDVPLHVTRLDPIAAELRHGGFPREVSPDGRKPDVYDPSIVDPSRPWKAHVGHYTAFGDVTPLLTQLDDRFVTTRSGDELELSFRAPAAPPDGFVRSWLLFADGYGKDMDPNSAAPTHVGPVPFHGMPHYPYGDDSPRPAGDDTGATRSVLPSGDGWPGAPLRSW